YTGALPFEIKSIRVRRRGFRLVFTKSVAKASVEALASYRIERYRYEHTGAYGSPELDRTQVSVEAAESAAGGLSVDLRISDLQTGWVYLISAAGVRSAGNEPLVHSVGAYTLHEIPEH
ncbi:MAG: hypothetical protein GY733_20305, partial [bacterium]|nr:hypothetical protein [bacterium]